MEIIFLGTSAGMPSRTRNVSALVLRKRSAKAWYLIDCGEGTQHQLLRTPLSLNRLEAIAITHLHGDHCYGLPGLLSSASMNGRTHPLRIVGPRQVKRFIEAIQASSGLHLTYPLEFTEVESLEGPLTLPDFSLEAGALSHGVASHAYAFSERQVERKLDTQRLEAQGVTAGPLWGRLFRGEDVWLDDGTQLKSVDYLLPTRRARKVVIGGDNDTPRLLDELCTGADVLVHEATYTQEVVARLGTHNGHSTAAGIAAFAEEKGIANLVLTHFSPRYVYARQAKPSIGDIEREARKCYRGRLFLANDFDSYRLSREGKLEGPERVASGVAKKQSASVWPMPLGRFRDAVVSQAMPGCGSVAAVTAVQGLALVMKALRVSQSGQDDSRLDSFNDDAQALLGVLGGHADEDAQAFEAYLAAKRNNNGQAARQQELASAIERVNQVPLVTANACLEGLALAMASLPFCKHALRSDVLAGGLLIHAGLSTVLLGVDANLSSLDDEQKQEEMACSRQALQQEADRKVEWLRQQAVES